MVDHFSQLCIGNPAIDLNRVPMLFVHVITWLDLLVSVPQLKREIKSHIIRILNAPVKPDIVTTGVATSGIASSPNGTGTRVIFVVGVNGAGKTTSIGKLANRLRQEGRSVVLCAADTFRAAAVEQLEIWAQRNGIDVIKQKSGADPAAVVYDAVAAAKARSSMLVTSLLIFDNARPPISSARPSRA